MVLNDAKPRVGTCGSTFLRALQVSGEAKRSLPPRDNDAARQQEKYLTCEDKCSPRTTKDPKNLYR